MSFHLGLTGSIGMGKSTTAALFAELGCAVWDADAAVHRLYGENGKAVGPMHNAFPDAIDAGVVNRDRLREIIQLNPDTIKQIEGIVHPLVADDRAEFIRTAAAEILVFDIPLLFETGGDAAMDAVACVTVSPEIQQSRVLARGTMTLLQFEQIRKKQMPNAEKCNRSDYVIETDSMDHARSQVRIVIQDIYRRLADA